MIFAVLGRHRHDGGQYRGYSADQYQTYAGYSSIAQAGYLILGIATMVCPGP